MNNTDAAGIRLALERIAKAQEQIVELLTTINDQLQEDNE